MHVKYPLSLRNVEDLLAERDIDICHETVLRFRRMKTLQTFRSVHAVFHNPFNQDRHLISREIYKAQRSAALVEWKTLAGQARRRLLHCVSGRQVVVGLTAPTRRTRKDPAAAFA